MVTAEDFGLVKGGRLLKHLGRIEFIARDVRARSLRAGVVATTYWSVLDRSVVVVVVIGLGWHVA